MNDITKSARWDHLERPRVVAMDNRLGVPIPVLDHGFVRLIDYMGDDAAIVQAARVSYGRGTKTPSDDRSLIRYLMRHRHTTPFEMCEIKLHVKLPIFVARQWIRHRTANVNEYSARYSILAREFYVPEHYDIQPQSKELHTGWPWFDEEGHLHDERADPRPHQKEHGMAREMARMVLPVNAYTEWYWKVDLHNLLHFLSLRADPHAQMEIRDYAEAILQIVQSWVPITSQAFDDYILGGVRFSATEMAYLREWIATVREALGTDNTNGVPMAPRSGSLSTRETTEFYDKLEIKPHD